MPLLRRLLALCAALVLLEARAVPAQDSAAAALKKIDRSLRRSVGRNDERTKRVIVTVKPGYRAQIRQALQAHGDVINADSPLVDALAVEIHSEDVAELAKHPWVELLSDDALVRVSARQSDQAAREMVRRITMARRRNNDRSDSEQTTVEGGQAVLRETLGLPRVPELTTPGGSGIGVAIVDSGISPNDDFAGRIAGFYDFTRGGIPTAPFDDHGHGTHVAGLIGSNGTLSDSEFTGVAPRVRLFGFRVLDQRGQGRTSDVIRAIEYIIANRIHLKIHVINMSLGHPIYAPASEDPLVRVVEKAIDAGIVVVIAAGNYGQSPETGEAGYTGITSPANAPSAISVGAVNAQGSVQRSDDAIARFSSRGPTWFDGFAKPDIVAPGHELVSDTSRSNYLYNLLTNNHRRSSSGHRFLQLSGTSMAAAVATGVVAVVLDANSRAHYFDSQPLTPNLVKAILQYTAVPVAQADPLTQGAGSVNAIGAVALASAIDRSAPVGSWWLRTGVSPYSHIGGQRYDWARRVIWGDEVLTGSLVYHNHKAWSLTAAWGDGNIVWGIHAEPLSDNIVWGTATTWAPRIVWPDRLIGHMDGLDDILWDAADDSVWRTLSLDNIVWGTWDGDNIVWGTWDGDNIVWGTDDNIVWGTDDNIVWGTDDNIVWGTALLGWEGIF